ncbi:redoxin domain-containing protein [Actinomycetes bacterium KLBMP 9797]
MPAIVAALVMLTALVLLNLLLTFGVIRKLREHARDLAPVVPRTTLAAGATVPDFTATTDRGEAVSTATFRGAGGLVAFLAPDCPACAEQLPAVRSRLADAAGGAGAVVVVLTRLHPDAASGGASGAGSGAAEAEAAALVEELGVAGGPALIVHEPLDGPAQTAFQVAAFPAFYLVDGDGRVEVATNAAAQLPARPRLDVVGTVRVR